MKMGFELTPEQNTAVYNRGGKLLVSAAAGSGKTKVLVDRLLSYIMDPEHPANVDDFLIITYTKAAASELRGKISAKLTERISENPENRHLQKQIQRLYLAKISTVHSFCSDILREYAYRLDLPADFRVADEQECFEIQADVLEKLMDSAYENAENDPDFCAFIDSQGFGRNDRKIPEIILKVYYAARCHLDPTGWLNWCIAAGQSQDVSDAGQTVWGKFLIDELHIFLEMQIKAFRNCIRLGESNGTMEKQVTLLEDTVSQLQALMDCTTWDEIVHFPPISWGTLRFSKKSTDAELQARIKAIRDSCKDSLMSQMRGFAEDSAQILKDLRESTGGAAGLAELVARFTADYEKQKRSRRILDFGDLEHCTLDLLLGKNRTAPTAAAKEIGSRFREIMVDEYQDSNAVQDAIFGALTEASQNCFMVGDVKQSIYQFRLADPGIFLEKYNAYRPAAQAAPLQGRKVLLGKNFRSSGGVIDAVNDVFTQCMSERVGGLHYGTDEMLYEGLPHTELPDPEVELYGIQVREDRYTEEAAFVAHRIRELLDGKHVVRNEQGLRPITADDIVILLRSPGSVGGQFQYALEKMGIPSTTGEQGNLLETPEISVLYGLLQIIGNPLQDIPLISVLASPVFGFTSEELAAFRSENKHCTVYEALTKSKTPKAAEFLRILDSLRQDARLYPITGLLDRIFLNTDLFRVYSAMADGRVRASNLQAFFQIASDYEANGKKDLYHFLQFMETAREKGFPNTGMQDGAGCVTIMSIHKSKGLEFPVVFLCGLSRVFNRESIQEQVLCHKELGLGLSAVDHALRIRYPTIAKKAIASKMVRESISEEMRVLYVAMTRARDRLIMTYAAKNLPAVLQDLSMRIDLSDQELMTGYVSCPGNWILQAALRRTEAGEFFQLGGHPDCAGPHKQPWCIHVVEAPEDTDCQQQTEEVNYAVPPELIEQIRKSLSFRYPYPAASRTPSKQTATQLKGREKDREAAENTKSLYSGQFRKPRFRKDELPSGRTYGTAMHAVMQYLDYSACTTADSVKTQIGMLVHQNKITQEQANMIRPDQISKIFSWELGKKLISGANILREFKFSILMDAENYYEDVAGEQILLQGVVDCAVVESDGITVIDYKTDRISAENGEKVISRYRMQVHSYGQALSRIFSLPIKGEYLYFFQLGKFIAV